MKNRLVIVGGTFDCFHAGHEALLGKAFSQGDHVLIGVSSDSLARRKGGMARPFEERKKAVAEFASKKKKLFEIFPLSSPFEPAASIREKAVLVASEETRENAEKINKMRKKRRLPQLKLIIMPLVASQDLLPISCKRIREGRIGLRGERKKPVCICVASSNPAKLDGVKKASKRIFKAVPVKFAAKPVKTSVSKQPFEKETLRGAEERARLAFSSDCDYSIGLESGLFIFKGKTYDFLWACVFDGETAYFGCSMGFEVPGKLASLVKNGLDLSEAFERLTGEKKVGMTGGVLSRISNGIAKREEMAEQAVLMAFVPRLSKTIL